MEVSGTPLRSVWIAVFCLGSLGCDGISTRANGAAAKSDLDSCDGEPHITSLQWDDDSELGVAAQAFAGIEGQCEGALRWSSETELPSTKATSMHVEVQLDHASARLVQHTDRRNHRSGCPNELEVNARVALHSDDGAVDAVQDTKVHYTPEAAITFGFSLAREEHHGSLMLQERKGETTMLSFELDGAGANCAGEIMLSTSSMSADGKGRGSAGRIGTWSASGCPVGQNLFDIDEPIGDSTLPALIADTWDGRELEGTWEDGTQTTLSLHVTPLPAATCSERRAHMRIVTQPVEVRYSTGDGRLVERKTTASVRAELTQDDQLDELSLWISDEMNCSSPSSQLDYTPTDCTQMKAATVQLGLNTSSGASDGGLHVYFIPRFGDERPERDTLALR